MALTKQLILTLFKELNVELEKLDTRADLFVIGGTAMVVAYDARPATKDIDGIWQPTEPIRELIKKISKKYDIEQDWLNDAAKGFISHIKDENPVVIFDGTFLSVSAPSPQYLLATKILSSRPDRDEPDIELLIRLCEFTTVDECLDVVEKYFPNRPIVARSQFTVEEILASMSKKPETH
ncbi:MAG TPA: DUF6036 family nucleotidyltransferase [Acidimicrobiia bacterium]|nr:DUF6036 family nucleotidyltransferase [Acidimicrobiia bacterium]